MPALICRIFVKKPGHLANREAIHLRYFMRIFPVSALIILCIVPYTCTADASPGIKGADGAEMVLIPAGDFHMGSPDDDAYPRDERPRHKVYTDAFYFDRYEVTNEMFAAFLNSVKTPVLFEEQRADWVVIRNDIDSDQKKDWWPTEISLEKGVYKAIKGFERYPVISVSWFAADAYCRWAGKRLPTEAEWEKTARGGVPDREYPWGNEVPTEGIIFKRAWINNALPAPMENVGNYHPNSFGVYDAAGNASEWCSDWYDSAYYKKSPDKNPKGPDSGVNKIIRGGSWASAAPYLRVAARNYSSPFRQNSGVGVRCVKDAEQ